MEFKEITAKEWEGNMFRKIADEWLLICAYDEKNQRLNAMTASWGGMGILWNKEVCFLFVRPQRYTHDLLESTDRFSVALLPEKLHEAHKVFGSKSGRDMDKMKQTGLHEIRIDGVAAPAEASCILVVKKLYTDSVKEGQVLDPSILKHYPQADYHTLYICEIEKVLTKG